MDKDNIENGFFFTDDVVDCEHVILDNIQSIIFFKKENVSIKLTELQRRFICCLLSGSVDKKDIIRTVWYRNHETISDNNYYQMIFQCRALFLRHGIPGEIIKTIPRFGVILSFHVCEQKIAGDEKQKKQSSRDKEGGQTGLNAINYKVTLGFTLFFAILMLLGASA